MNNAFMTGAENHQPFGNAGAGYDTTPYPEGDFYQRINNAMQAWYEYMPIREPSAALLATTTAFNTALNTYLTNATGAAAAFGYTSVQTIAGAPVTNLTAITRARIANQQRTFNFGGLITYVLTEDRLAFRTSAEALLNNGQYLELGGLDCPACPTLAPSCLVPQTTQYVAAITNYSMQMPANFPTQCSPQLLGLLANSMMTTNIVNFTSAQVATLNQLQVVTALEALQAYNGNITQHLIGTLPALYIGTQFAQSRAAGIPFQVWASQTVFSPQPLPDLINATTKGRATSQQTGQYLLSALCGSSLLHPVCAGALAGFTFEGDDWDGFNTERNFILQMLAMGVTPIINSGDSHSFYLGVVPNATFSPGPTSPLAVEFGGGSVTSAGWGDSFSAVVAPGYTMSATSNGFFNWIEDGHVIAAKAAGYGLQAVRHVHGALVFKVNSSSYVGQVYTVDTMNSTSYNAMCDYAYNVPPGTRGVMNSLATGTTGFTANPGCVNTINGSVPGTFFVTTQGGMALTAGLPPQQTIRPIPPPPPSPSPPPPPPATSAVSSSITLIGVTQLTQAVSTALVNTLSSTLGVPTAAITITTPITGRRLLQSLTVSFTIATTNINTAALLSQQLSTLSSPTGSASFVSALSQQLQMQSAGVSVTSVTVSQPVTGGFTAPTKVQPWNAHKKISIGLGVGLGLGIGLPLVIITAYCCRPKPTEGKMVPAEQPVVVVPVPVVVASV